MDSNTNHVQNCDLLRHHLRLPGSGSFDMSFRSLLSRPLKKLEHRLVGGRRKPDRSEAEIAGEDVKLTDMPPRPESGVVVGGDGNETGSGEGEVGSMGSPPQPDDLGAAAEDEREPELGQSRIDVDEGEVGLGDSPQHLDGEEEPGNRHSRESGEVVVEGEVGPVDPPQPPNLRVSGDREPSGGTWGASFGSLQDH